MAELKFEEALKKLESIVEGLEQGKISLEESLKKYEDGIKLAKFCAEQLESAEKKIEILTKDNSGKLKREPFKIEEDESPPAPSRKNQKQKQDFLL